MATPQASIDEVTSLIEEIARRLVSYHPKGLHPSAPLAMRAHALRRRVLLWLHTLPAQSEVEEARKEALALHAELAAPSPPS